VAAVSRQVYLALLYGCAARYQSNALIINFSNVSNFAQTPRVVRQTIAAGGVLFGWERSMTKAEQFREYAEEAMQWSRKAKTEAARQKLLGLAFTWIQAALISDRTFVGPQRA
jgi:hypothetical protein